MVGSWGTVPWLVRTQNGSDESMATWGPGRRMAKRADSFSPSRKRRRSNPKSNTEEEDNVRGSVAMVEILKVLKAPKSGRTPTKTGWTKSRDNSIKWDFQAGTGRSPGTKVSRKPEERPRVGVLDHGLKKSDFLRGREKREEFIQRHETWVKRREEARGAEDAAREARHIFKISVERFLAGKEVEEGRSKEVAEKVWQPSQRYHKKGENLEADLNNL